MSGLSSDDPSFIVLCTCDLLMSSTDWSATWSAYLGKSSTMESLCDSMLDKFGVDKNTILKSVRETGHANTSAASGHDASMHPHTSAEADAAAHGAPQVHSQTSTKANSGGNLTLILMHLCNCVFIHTMCLLFIYYHHAPANLGPVRRNCKLKECSEPLNLVKQHSALALSKWPN